MRTRLSWLVAGPLLLAGCGNNGEASGTSREAGGGGAASSSSSTSSTSSAGGAHGDAGTGGGGPHHVAACDGLGAVDQWEQIAPADVDLDPANTLGILNVVTDPANAGTIYVGTDHQGLWKSTSCGADWSKINTGRNAAVLDSGSLWTVTLDPLDPNGLYAASLYGTDPSLLKSTNGGADWDSLFPQGGTVASHVQYNFFQALGIDPTDAHHLVVTFHADCSGATGPMCLGESTDAGATWRLFKGPTAAWQERAGVIVFGPKDFLFHTWGNGMYATSDGGDTWNQVGPGSNFQMYHAADGYDYLGSAYGMRRSKDGKTWDTFDGAPQGDSLIGDGERMFTAWDDAAPKYATAKETDGTKWSSFDGPVPGTMHRVTGFAYDSDHHVLYAATTNDGLWRMVTR